MKKLNPRADFVLVRRQKIEKVKGGIIIPETAQQVPNEGEILEVGAGRLLQDGRRVPVDYAIGDWVLFGQYAGAELSREQIAQLGWSDGLYVILREDEIYGAVAWVEEPTGRARNPDGRFITVAAPDAVVATW